MERLIADRYEIVGRLGEGAFGEVLRVRDAQSGEILALKLLKPVPAGSTSLQRFHREFRVIAGLRHPNIVRVHDMGVHSTDAGERPYFTMELLTGADLAAWALGNRPRPAHPGYDLYARDVAYIFHQMADALAAVHAAGVVHRDIKPANVFVRAGRNPRVKLLDFGHARNDEGENLTQTGTVLGTASYMAPEQAMGGRPAPPADLYALGCVLFETLTGAPPYEGQSVVHVLLGHVQKPVRDPREADDRVPEVLAALCVRLMAKDPDRRHASAADVAAELAAL